MIKQAGFGGISLWWGDERDADYIKHPEQAREMGFLVENAHVGYKRTNNLWLDNIDGASMTDYLIQCVKDCAVAEVPAIVVHLTTGKTPPPFNAMGLDRIKRIVEQAERLNANIALENLRKPEYLEFVLGEIDSPRLGFCYDSGHHLLYAPNEDLLGKYGDRLMAIHLHDNDGSADQHLLPFDGNIDWIKTMGAIKATGYSGGVSLEVLKTKYEVLTAEEFLQAAFERAKRLEEIL